MKVHLAGGKTQYWFPTPSSPIANRAIIGSLWAATRQFVHERSGLPLPPSSLRPLALLPSQLPALLAQRAATLIPTFYRLPHLPLTSATHLTTGAISCQRTQALGKKRASVEPSYPRCRRVCKTRSTNDGAVQVGNQG